MRRKKGNTGVSMLVLGYFVIFLICVLSYALIELKSNTLKSLVIDSVLKQSALSSLKYDIKEYGTTHKIRINPNEVDVNGETPYDSFVFSLKQGLYLDDNLKSKNNKYVYGQVTVNKFIIYNVDKVAKTVEVITKVGNTYNTEINKPLGLYKDSDGKIVSETSVLVEIGFTVEVGGKTGSDVENNTFIDSTRSFTVGISEK